MPTKKIKALGCVWVGMCAALLAVTALAPRATAADGDDPPGRVARLSYLRGAVSFQPAGESDWVTATINRPMTTGDKLWADMDSRAELHIGSAAIRLDSNTGFSFLNLDDRTTQIQLSAGTINIRVRRMERDEVFEVDTPNQAFSILRPGRYRLEASEDGNSTLVEVMDGKGEASGGGRSYTIERGERAALNGTDTLDADIDRIGRRDRDEFDDWCEERERREDRSRSVRYVSPEMVGYEDLDENGVWRYDPGYGEVWVPTAVPVGWAPYHYGHWAWIAPWGWTWVDDAPWGYAPFHYGRWAYARGGWCWVPGPIAERPVYAPALVAFVGGPRFAVGVAVGGVAVGWFPLGPREVYVPAYRVSPEYVTRVNVSNTNVNRTTVTNVYNRTVVNNTTVVNNVTYVNRGAPGAVTAVSTTAFTTAQPVATSTVRVNQSEIVNAPVVTRAAVVPTQSSVLGPAKPMPPGHTRVPPGLVNRPVVAKTPPPPPAVSFERQQAILAAHPGQPLARNEVETLRPASVAHPLVRPASPNQPGFANPGRGVGQVEGTRGESNRERGNPNFPGNGAPNRPADNPSVNAPRNDRPNFGRPDFGRRENSPATSEAPNGQPNNRPGNSVPPTVQPNNRQEQPVNTPSPTPNNRPFTNPSYRPPSREDRPNPGARGNERPSINNQPPGGNNEPPNRPAPYQPNERPSIDNRPQNAPTPEPPNNRPSSSQPIYRPPAPENRPNPGQPSNERPSINSQPSARNNEPPSRPATPPQAERPPINTQPQNTPSEAPNRRFEPPSNAPVSRPANPPAPVNRPPAASPQPSGNVRAVPENRGRPSAPAPARNNNEGGKKDKNEKKN